MARDDIWDGFFGADFDAFNRRINRMFSEMENLAGADVKTYGYTMYQGPDGVPHFREFGNTPGGNVRIASRGSDEPFSDVVRDGDVVRATVELPGVAKEDISLEGSRNTLVVSVDTPTKQFSKTLALPCDVDADSARAVYNNGMLEVTIDVVGGNGGRQKIAIE